MIYQHIFQSTKDSGNTCFGSPIPRTSETSMTTIMLTSIKITQHNHHCICDNMFIERVLIVACFCVPINAKCVKNSFMWLNYVSTQKNEYVLYVCMFPSLQYVWKIALIKLCKCLEKNRSMLVRSVLIVAWFFINVMYMKLFFTWLNYVLEICLNHTFHTQIFFMFVIK